MSFFVLRKRHRRRTVKAATLPSTIPTHSNVLTIRLQATQLYTNKTHRRIFGQRQKLKCAPSRLLPPSSRSLFLSFFCPVGSWQRTPVPALPANSERIAPRVGQAPSSASTPLLLPRPAARQAQVRADITKLIRRSEKAQMTIAHKETVVQRGERMRMTRHWSQRGLAWWCDYRDGIFATRVLD